MVLKKTTVHFSQSIGIDGLGKALNEYILEIVAKFMMKIVALESF